MSNHHGQALTSAKVEDLLHQGGGAAKKAGSEVINNHINSGPTNAPDAFAKNVGAISASEVPTNIPDTSTGHPGVTLTDHIKEKPVGSYMGKVGPVSEAGLAGGAMAVGGVRWAKNKFQKSKEKTQKTEKVNKVNSEDEKAKKINPENKAKKIKKTKEIKKQDKLEKEIIRKYEISPEDDFHSRSKKILQKISLDSPENWRIMKDVKLAELEKSKLSVKLIKNIKALQKDSLTWLGKSAKPKKSDTIKSWIGKIIKNSLEQ